MRNDLGISGTSGRAGALRTNVWTRPGPAGGVPRPFDERARASGPARRLLRQPAQSFRSGEGPAHHQSRAGARERIGAIGYGRNAAGKGKTGKCKIRKLNSEI